MIKVNAGELRQFIERIERVDAERSDLSEARKEILAEAKGSGYDTKMLNMLVARRKRSADDIAEEEALFETYIDAMGGE